ncbi:hypothetical protein GGTG_09883 [Gaeumannomyces tritici R3-111a-1]|uniref:Uncharacterized protein n=1 Tax=Gaeumannomyces tritici (strain R3-111a-1) TaxID=644352 RepID=J3P8P8_GAET3|nr:hypothetical protein GGTG_09883 [Gaeumannomyces tritici R3-111a-1]EJT73032.1 hypothetical protein GGTG_09883 [Gaeumannomyces tritici R3-111a-1]
MGVKLYTLKTGFFKRIAVFLKNYLNFHYGNESLRVCKRDKIHEKINPFKKGCNFFRSGFACGILCFKRFFMLGFKITFARAFIAKKSKFRVSLASTFGINNKICFGKKNFVKGNFKSGLKVAGLIIVASKRDKHGIRLFRLICFKKKGFKVQATFGINNKICFGKKNFVKGNFKSGLKVAGLIIVASKRDKHGIRLFRLICFKKKGFKVQGPVKAFALYIHVTPCPPCLLSFPLNAWKRHTLPGRGTALPMPQASDIYA